MEKVLFLLVLIAIFKPSISDVSPDFKSFMSCLQRIGFPAKALVQESSNSSFYSQLNHQWQENWAKIYPQGFLLVETEEDILNVVKCGRDCNVRVVAKSGGHSYEKHSFGDSNSVILDLQKMNQVKVNKNMKTAEVGPGGILGNLQWKLWIMDKSFIPLGTYPYVGITGLATGGGHGSFTRKYGLAVDHIVEMNIVTADCVLRVVNKDNDSDLFWALRGGGGASFGIITKLVFNVFQVPPRVYDGLLKFNITQFEEVLIAYQDLAISGPREVMSLMGISDGEIRVKFWISSGSQEMFEGICSAFPTPLTKSGHVYNYPDFLMATAKWELGSDTVDLENLRSENDKQHSFSHKALYTTRKLESREIRQMQEKLTSMPKSVSCGFDTYGGAINDFGEAETAFIHRTGRILLIGIDHMRDGPSTPANDVDIKWQNEFFNLVDSFFEKREAYQNYPHRDFKDYLKRYYGNNLPRLVQVKSKYDPDNYFHNPQSIPTQMLFSRSKAGPDTNSFAQAYLYVMALLSVFLYTLQ